jgi:hypothetical protein
MPTGIDPGFQESVGRWPLARAVWIVLILASLPASALVWFVGAVSFCGTDTTEPGAFGDWACGALVRPVVPWVAVAAIPLAILVVGGLMAVRREDWRLFAISVLAPPIGLAVAYFAVLAAF